jgi:hypothetical protein
MALFPVSAQPTNGGGYAGSSRHYRLSPDREIVGEKFGRHFANDIRKRSACWHGEKLWLWCAVDQDGFVLDVLVQCRHGGMNFFGRTASIDATVRCILPGQAWDDYLFCKLKAKLVAKLSFREVRDVESLRYNVSDGIIYIMELAETSQR